MYHGDHNPPHFHVRYGSERAQLAIDDLRILAGHLSPRVRGLVVEWASRHQDALRLDWELAVTRQPLKPIEPLE